jgi:hypothetical protein
VRQRSHHPAASVRLIVTTGKAYSHAALRKGSFAQRAFTQRSYIADADDSVKSDVPHVI